MVDQSVKVSIVIPVHNEGENLEHNIQIIKSYMNPHEHTYEIILIDDGSIDDSWSIIEKLSFTNPQIKGFKFTRNFGKEAAMFAGLKRARGMAVIVMDSDLQHPPNLLKEMIKEWDQNKFMIVEAIKRRRSDKNALYQMAAKVYNSIFSHITGLDLTNSSDYKLLDRKVVEALLEMYEINTFFRGMVTWTGFTSKTLFFDVPKRREDRSKFSLLSLTRLAITSITTFSSVPLQLVTYIGLIFLIISIIGTGHTLTKYFKGQALEGFTTLILLLLFTGSLIMIALGIIGIYLSKIFDEVKRRPRYIIEGKAY